MTTRSLTSRLLPGAMVSYGRRMNAAATRTSTSTARGTSHQRRRRDTDGNCPPSPCGAASTISLVVSGLMVSLAVVVAAILAVLVLVFSDQPATEQVRRLRGSRRQSPPRFPEPGPALAPQVAGPTLL